MWGIRKIGVRTEVRSSTLVHNKTELPFVLQQTVFVFPTISKTQSVAHSNTQKNMKILAILLLCCALELFAQTGQPTQIYLVRHAEKSTLDTNNNNPLLTKDGQERATALALHLKNIPVSVVYSTDYQRTKQTAQPIAEQQKITLNIYDPRQLKTFASSILTEYKGKNVLVVGHSNTVLETIEALGGTRPIPRITDQEYDYLFLVNVSVDGVLTVKVSHFGKPSVRN
jgi:broad specificity phosphatase PhoE